MSFPISSHISTVRGDVGITGIYSFRIFSMPTKLTNQEIKCLHSGYPVYSAYRPDADSDICHSGQAKRSAGVSSFLAGARVWEIPVFPCGETGMTVLE